MTEKAKELLIKMASTYDENQKNYFDSLYYMGFPDSVVNELGACGCIIKQNDIAGTIKLTEFGYAEAKK